MNLYKKHLNGILADETGLGKTVQTVAYMAHLAGQEGMALFKDIHDFLIGFVLYSYYLFLCVHFCPQASGDPTLL